MSQAHQIVTDNRAALEAQMRLTYQDARALLRSGPLDKELLKTVVASTHAALDTTCQDVLADANQKPGCRAGCAACCHQPVDVSSAELAFIAATTFPEDWPPVLERAERVIARSGGDKTRRYPLGLACPFLEGANCGIHPIRPTACRTYFSLSRLACERGWRKRHHANGGQGKGIPLTGTTMAVGFGFMTGMDRALHEAGLEIEIVELVEGLRVILQPGALDRWLAGERVFAGLRRHTDATDATYSALLGQGDRVFHGGIK